MKGVESVIWEGMMNLATATTQATTATPNCKSDSLNSRFKAKYLLILAHTCTLTRRVRRRRPPARADRRASFSESESSSSSSVMSRLGAPPKEDATPIEESSSFQLSCWQRSVEARLWLSVEVAEEEESHPSRTSSSVSTASSSPGAASAATESEEPTPTTSRRSARTSPPLVAARWRGKGKAGFERAAPRRPGCAGDNAGDFE